MSHIENSAKILACNPIKIKEVPGRPHRLASETFASRINLGDSFIDFAIADHQRRHETNHIVGCRYSQEPLYPHCRQQITVRHNTLQAKDEADAREHRRGQSDIC